MNIQQINNALSRFEGHNGYSVMGANRNDALAALGLSGENLFGEEALKALALDGAFGTAADNMVGESLDNVIFQLTMDERNHIAFLKRVYNYVAKAHKEEYRRVSKLGFADFSAGGREEVNLGVEDSPKFDSVTDTIKYKGRVAVVSRSLQRASMAKFNDMLARVSALHIRMLLLQGEWSMFWGDDALNSLEIKGLLARIKDDSTHKIDQRITSVQASRSTGLEITGGNKLDSDTVRRSMETPLFKGGRHSALYLSTTDLTEISLTEDGRQRWGWQKMPSLIETGKTVQAIANPFGPATELVWSPFLRYERGRQQDTPKDPTKLTGSDAQFHSKVPARLGTAAGLTAQAGGYLPASKTFYYAVAPVGATAGEGPIKTDRTVVASTNATNGQVQVRITHPASIGDIKSYRIYRSSKQPASNDDNTVFRLVGEVAIDTTSSTQDWIDDGTFVPGSRRAALVDEEAIRIPELLKPSQRDLADVTNAHQRSFDWEYGFQEQSGGEYPVEFFNIGGSVENPA